MLQHIVGAIAPSVFTGQRAAAAPGEKEEGHALEEVGADRLDTMALLLIVRTPSAEDAGPRTHAAFLVPHPPPAGAMRRCLLLLQSGCTTTTTTTTTITSPEEEEEERRTLERVELHPGLLAFRVEAGPAVSYRVRTLPIALARDAAAAAAPRTATWRTTTTTTPAADMASGAVTDDRCWVSDANMDVGRFAWALHHHQQQQHRRHSTTTGAPPQAIVHYSAELWPDARWMTGHVVCGAQRITFTRVVRPPAC
jgi:hypothetical protein